DPHPSTRLITDAPPETFGRTRSSAQVGPDELVDGPATGRRGKQSPAPTAVAPPLQTGTRTSTFGRQSRACLGGTAEPVLPVQLIHRPPHVSRRIAAKASKSEPLV